tara:strand:+ start:147 stop:311 length:165 start_codon:yes stop_codon:yes gene_type:complete
LDQNILALKATRLMISKKSMIKAKYLIYFDKNNTKLKEVKIRRKYKLVSPVKIN